MNNEIKIPKAAKQVAPIVNIDNTVNVPEAQVIIEKETGTETVEVLERDADGKLLRLRKTKE